MIVDDDNRSYPMITEEYGPGMMLGVGTFFNAAAVPIGNAQVLENGEVYAVDYGIARKHLNNLPSEEAVRLMKWIGAHVVRQSALHKKRWVHSRRFNSNDQILHYLWSACKDEKGLTHPEGYELEINRRRISSTLGLTREEVTHAMHRLENTGALRLNGRSKKIVVVVDRYAPIPMHLSRLEQYEPKKA